MILFIAIGIINCVRHDNLVFEEVPVEEMQAEIGDDSLGEISENRLPQWDGLQAEYHANAFMRIVEELGLS